MTSEPSAQIQAETTGVPVPHTLASRLKILGPGLALAATTVGVGDLISSLVAGERFGMTFLWAIVVAVILKYFLTEGLGRWHLASGQTIIQGWDSMSRVFTALILIYILLWALAYGAAGPSVVGLAVNAIAPVLPEKAWAIIFSLIAFSVILLGRYHLFERLMKLFIAAKVAIVILITILLRPKLGDIAAGLVPHIPPGSLLYAVSIVGGLGGTLALAAYGYWIRDKGWRDRGWIPVMRLDVGLGYVFTAVFGAAVLIIGAAFLFNTGKNIEGNTGLVTLANPLGNRFGEVIRWIFLVGIWAISFASVMGTLNGMSYLFADIVRTFRRIPEDEAERHTSEKSPFYRLFLVLMTFPPMILILIGSPVALVILWTTMGALFLPFLSLTLLILLNSKRVAPEYRSHPVSLSNVVLVASLVVFLVLAMQAIAGLF